MTYKHYSDNNWLLSPNQYQWVAYITFLSWWASPEGMLDYDSIDLFYFHILSTKTGFCHMRKNLLHTKNPELFLWSSSVEARTIKKFILYTTNEADKCRWLVLCIHSTSEMQIWDVSKNFQVPPFQQHRGMPADCFHNSIFCVIYSLSHLLFWPYSGFMFHLIQPNCQLLLPRMVLLYLFWKCVPSAIPMWDTAIPWPQSMSEQCTASEKNNT